jgi:hypothetical protein
VLLARSARPLLDSASRTPQPSKYLPKALLQLADACSALRLCVGSARAEPVDFDRALLSHVHLKDALVSHSVDDVVASLSGGDKQVQEEVKAVLLDWTAEMRRLDNACKDPVCPKLFDLEQHWLSAHAAISSTLAAAANPSSPPLRLVEACMRLMDRDNQFRIMCRAPKANFEQARQDLSNRFKVAESSLAALRDLKVETLVASGSIPALRSAAVPMLKTLVERGRESSSRSSQAADFMLLLSYDVFEQIICVLERFGNVSLLKLPREEYVTVNLTM